VRVYEAIVKGLESVGVDAAFGGAGENSASLLLALKHSTKIRPVIARHEQAASFMACGYAIYSNRLGVCSRPPVPAPSTCFPDLPSRCPIPIRSWRSPASPGWHGREKAL
jgi:acetolactate synthase-1/2/3 large subunit